MPEEAPAPEQTWYTWTAGVTGASLVYQSINVIRDSLGLGTVGTPGNTTFVEYVNVPWRVEMGYRPRELTPAEQERERLAEAERRQRREERQRLDEAAVARSLALLRGLLNAEQWEQYETCRSFHVTGRSGQLYEIRHGNVGNVSTVDEDGQLVVDYCAHPELWDDVRQGYLPIPDVLAAQALALMTDDEAFLRVANVHHVHR